MSIACILQLKDQLAILNREPIDALLVGDGRRRKKYRHRNSGQNDDFAHHLFGRPGCWRLETRRWKLFSDQAVGLLGKAERHHRADADDTVLLWPHGDNRREKDHVIARRELGLPVRSLIPLESA